MSTNETEPADDSDKSDEEQQSVELSLDQLSQAYAQVMRDQGNDEAEADGNGRDSDTEIDEDDVELSDDDQPASPVTKARGKKSYDEIDSADNAACPISPKSIVESLLFVGAPSGAKLTSRILASAMRDVSPKEIKNIVAELNLDYEELGAAFRIVSEDRSYKLQLQAELAEFQDHFFGRNRPARLSQNAIDVLAVVAYNQPVARSQVEKIRARPSGSALSQLVKRDLVETVSRENKKDLLFQTTGRFLELFGLGNLDDLPQTSAVSDLEELSDF